MGIKWGNGDGGKRDLGEARRWVDRACQLGDRDACQFLGEIKGLAALVRHRVEALNGIADLRTLRPDARYFVFSEEMLRFCIQNRHAVIVLLGRSANTLHEGFSEQLIDELVALAIAYAESVRADFEPTPVLRFALEQLYRNLVAFMVELLERYADEPTIRAAVAAFSRYHLTGMRNLLAGELLDGT